MFIYVVFKYYQRLSASARRTYDASDAIETVEVPGAAELWPAVADIRSALETERRAKLEEGCQRLADSLFGQLDAPLLRVRVLAARPSHDWGELHGLYEPEDGESNTARVTVWMRTAQQRRVVAFKTFLRTLVHEMLHHLDYEHFGLADSFHTEGFFKRESEMTRQLLEAGE
ncbi:MAG: hypothetical protein OEM62_01790 [Acidobacteriota bacterium]|nr:hypothetical protein [Acidobacteriota bacterium]